MVRSVPEKTFEHWISMYIAHRFPSGGIWWPSFGEDVRVEDLGTLPGKACLLEAKVTEQLANGTHKATIDLAQLEKYCSSVIPVYYVIPEPQWQHHLDSSFWIGRERKADLAYRRTMERWFGEWTFVCLAKDLYSHLSPANGQATATLHGRPRPSWSWSDFWKKFSRCGDDQMPAVMMPSSDLGSSTTRAQIRSDLIDLKTKFDRSRRQGSRMEQRRHLQESWPRYIYVPRNGLYFRSSSWEIYEDPAVSEIRDSNGVVPEESSSAVASISFDSIV